MHSAQTPHPTPDDVEHAELEMLLKLEILAAAVVVGVGVGELVCDARLMTSASGMQGRLLSPSSPMYTPACPMHAPQV
jgi:hypothetical protein